MKSAAAAAAAASSPGPNNTTTWCLMGWGHSGRRASRELAVASTPAEPPHVLVVLPCRWAFSVVATGPSISKAELLEFWDQISDTSFDGRLQTFFDMVDKDADGRITEEEVKEIITLSASANKLSKITDQAEEYARLIMEEPGLHQAVQPGDAAPAGAEPVGAHRHHQQPVLLLVRASGRPDTFRPTG
ncbi:uncharacterized protein [Zea mays]|uniref:uncharacterized protein n=1 Tax=Zea mays TaxID=4577 RepID=UPI001652BCA8|nr:uncharacterized protein LOC118473470 [Zea mays]